VKKTTKIQGEEKLKGTDLFC